MNKSTESSRVAVARMFEEAAPDAGNLLSGIILCTCVAFQLVTGNIFRGVTLLIFDWSVILLLS